MDLEALIMDVLTSDRSQALTFDGVKEGVAERLADDIRETLNRLHGLNQIKRHVGGRDHSWRYQAIPLKLRRL